MWSWGANKKGQLGIGKTGGNCSTPQQGWCNIFACDIFQVLKHHENLFTEGVYQHCGINSSSNLHIVLFSDGQQIIEVVAGAYHSAVLTSKSL